MNEPVSDAVRGILDGHILLSRRLAAMNHYPAIDVLGSVSRTMPQVTSGLHRQMAARFRSALAIYRENEDLVNIGAYQAGANPALDHALRKLAPMNQYLTQGTQALTEMESAIAGLNDLFPEGDQ